MCSDFNSLCVSFKLCFIQHINLSPKYFWLEYVLSGEKIKSVLIAIYGYIKIRQASFLSGRSYRLTNKDNL